MRDGGEVLLEEEKEESGQCAAARQKWRIPKYEMCNRVFNCTVIKVADELLL